VSGAGDDWLAELRERDDLSLEEIDAVLTVLAGRMQSLLSWVAVGDGPPSATLVARLGDAAPPVLADYDLFTFKRIARAFEIWGMAKEAGRA